jgi:hypothetical protein
VGHSANFYLTPPSTGLRSTNRTWLNAEGGIAVSWVNRFGLRREAVFDDLAILNNVSDNTA